MKDYVKMFDDCCGTCDHYCWDESPRTKGFRCNHHCDYYNPGEKKCWSYYRKPIDNYTIDRKMDEWDRYKRWYIVTAVSNILGIPEENNPYRAAFARIIEEYLIGTKDGEQLLAEYDVYGKEIAWILEAYARNDDHSSEVRRIAKEEIIPEFDKMLEDVNNNRVNHAMLRYIVFTRRLMQRLNIPYRPVEPKYEETEYSPLHNTLLALKRSK